MESGNSSISVRIDKCIKNTSAEGDALIIDANEYMTHGDGRSVSKADFKF